MFEFDVGKLVIIGIVALIFIGPKELPRVLRQVGQAVAKIRRMGSEFQAQFMDAIREADLEEVKLEAAKIAEAAKFDTGMDPLAGIRAEMTKNMDEMSETVSRPAVSEGAASEAAPLATHTEPLIQALHDDAAAGEAAAEQRALTDEPVAHAVPLAAVSKVAVEPVLCSEPLHKRA
jgi:sec-independent protein translocase protein TatB